MQSSSVGYLIVIVMSKVGVEFFSGLPYCDCDVEGTCRVLQWATLL